MGLRNEDLKFLRDLQKKLNTQGFDGNADPAFWGIMEKRDVAANEGCGDSYRVQYNGTIYVEDDAVSLLEAMMDLDRCTCFKERLEEICTFAELIDIIKDYSLSQFEILEYSSVAVLSRDTGAFLTKEAALHHIEINGHNMSHPRTYAMTAYQNPEYEQLLRILRSADFDSLVPESLPIIRPLKMSDAVRVDKMDEESGHSVLEWLDIEEGKEFSDNIYGAFLDDELIGYCVVNWAGGCGEVIEKHPLWSEEARLLYAVYIKKEHRRSGLGTRLVKEALEMANGRDKEPVFITIVNERLRDFYDPMGFQCIDDENYAMILL